MNDPTVYLSPEGVDRVYSKADDETLTRLLKPDRPYMPTLKELADELGISLGATISRVDRLKKRGLVTNPKRRSRVMQVTDLGKTLHSQNKRTYR